MPHIFGLLNTILFTNAPSFQCEFKSLIDTIATFNEVKLNRKKKKWKTICIDPHLKLISFTLAWCHTFFFQPNLIQEINIIFYKLALCTEVGWGPIFLCTYDGRERQRTFSVIISSGKYNFPMKMIIISFSTLFAILSI